MIRFADACGAFATERLINGDCCWDNFSSRSTSEKDRHQPIGLPHDPGARENRSLAATALNHLSITAYDTINIVGICQNVAASGDTVHSYNLPISLIKFAAPRNHLSLSALRRRRNFMTNHCTTLALERMQLIVKGWRVNRSDPQMNVHSQKAAGGRPFIALILDARNHQPFR